MEKFQTQPENNKQDKVTLSTAVQIASDIQTNPTNFLNFLQKWQNTTYDQLLPNEKSKADALKQEAIQLALIAIKYDHITIFNALIELTIRKSIDLKQLHKDKTLPEHIIDKMLELNPKSFKFNEKTKVFEFTGASPTHTFELLEKILPLYCRNLAHMVAFFRGLLAYIIQNHSKAIFKAFLAGLIKFLNKDKHLTQDLQWQRIQRILLEGSGCDGLPPILIGLDGQTAINLQTRIQICKFTQTQKTNFSLAYTLNAAQEKDLSEYQKIFVNLLKTLWDIYNKQLLLAFNVLAQQYCGEKIGFIGKAAKSSGKVKPDPLTQRTYEWFRATLDLIEYTPTSQFNWQTTNLFIDLLRLVLAELKKSLENIEMAEAKEKRKSQPLISCGVQDTQQARNAINNMETALAKTESDLKLQKTTFEEERKKEKESQQKQQPDPKYSKDTEKKKKDLEELDKKQEKKKNPSETRSNRSRSTTVRGTPEFFQSEKLKSDVPKDTSQQNQSSSQTFFGPAPNLPNTNPNNTNSQTQEEKTQLRSGPVIGTKRPGPNQTQNEN